MLSQAASSTDIRSKKNARISILKEILRQIKLDEKLIKENNIILHAFLNTFLDQMKRVDQLFEFLYKELYFTGSFYSDLRVSMPDEFDINLKLKLPFTESDFEVVIQPQAPSFVKYRLKNHLVQLDKHHRLVSTLFENGFLIPMNVRKWLQSVVDKAKIDYKPPNQCIGMHVKQAGPARTIVLEKNSGVIDIDLVPVISCTLDLQNLDGRVVSKVGGRKLMTFLVPKPYSNSGKQMPVNKTEIRCLWRSHFPLAEERVIHNLGCVKPIIKLLKLFRDKEGWKIFSSYYLKTVVMWMIIENSTQDYYWKEDKIDERFIEALIKLDSFVNQNKIPYFFNKKHNLIEKMNPDQGRNIHDRLTYWIRVINENPNQLWKAFRMKPHYVNS